MQCLNQSIPLAESAFVVELVGKLKGQSRLSLSMLDAYSPNAALEPRANLCVDCVGFVMCVCMRDAFVAPSHYVCLHARCIVAPFLSFLLMCTHVDLAAHVTLLHTFSYCTCYLAAHVTLLHTLSYCTCYLAAHGDLAAGGRCTVNNVWRAQPTGVGMMTPVATAWRSSILSLASWKWHCS